MGYPEWARAAPFAALAVGRRGRRVGVRAIVSFRRPASHRGACAARPRPSPRWCSEPPIGAGPLSCASLRTMALSCSLSAHSFAFGPSFPGVPLKQVGASAVASFGLPFDFEVPPPHQGCQFLSFSGPDASKVGTDFSVTLGVVMSAEAKVAAHCYPQAPQGLRRERAGLGTIFGADVSSFGPLAGHVANRRAPKRAAA